MEENTRATGGIIGTTGLDISNSMMEASILGVS